MSKNLADHALSSVSRRLVLAAGFGVAALAVPTAGFAQAAKPAFPSVITILVGFAPGTGPDVLARLLAAGLQKQTGSNVIVENAAGAGGQIAAGRVAKAAGDGATLLLGEIGSLAVAPFAFTSLPYDVSKDFAPISEVARANFALIVPAKSNHASIASFIEDARKQDRTLFATFGITTPGHVAAEMFGQTYGIKTQVVHYRGVADVITDLGNNLTAGSFVSVPLAAAQRSSGNIKVLAQTGKTRSSLLSDVPTSEEAKVPEFNVSAWFTLMAPASVPAPLIAAYNDAANAALKDPEAGPKLTAAGFEAVGTSVDATRQMMATEGARWKAVIDKAGIKVTP